ncbi:MAG: sigma 54-interacting transcriptional regulator [Desulfobacteraceae bacterium]|nr:sigma 54-interacting transcriptional regulator [Desulfobacteraceae bacterium]
MEQQELDYYWKTVVDTIQDGVMIVDTDGTVVSVNRAFEEITGYTAEEIVGRSCSVLSCSTCQFARASKGCHFCLMFEKGVLRKQRCAVIRKDGRTVHIVKNASIIRDRDGVTTGAVETMTDITDLIEKETQIETFRRELNAEDRFHGMIGTSPAMKRVFELIANAAQSDAPVIVFGESGTGKELVAQAIHEAGKRGKNPFVKVNCAALNESLLESELFGHVKGSFTGAVRDRKGRFEAAHGGDIFLDEIGDLPMSTQVKLLRVIEEKVIERVGDHRPVTVDVRIISATNRDLQERITEGAFREDFYYRINVIPISVPALRERIEDIPLLAQSFFRRIRLKSGKAIQGISEEALERLTSYSWPGNVRELKSAFEYAFVACSGKSIGPEHLPPAVLRQAPPPAASPKGDIVSEDMDTVKKRRLEDALRRTGGNRSAAARILGISRTSVWNQIKRYGIAP